MDLRDGVENDLEDVDGCGLSKKIRYDDQQIERRQ
jgi:hypothetical protein